MYYPPPPKGRQYNYPTHVVKDKIKYLGTKNLRFRLIIPFNNPSSKKRLVVIMKNPSASNLNTCDKSTHNICGCVNNTNFSNTTYQKVVILNLFPFFAVKATDLKNFFNKWYYRIVMAINMFFIKKYRNAKNTDIIFAWGQNTIINGLTNAEKNKIEKLYNKRIEKVTKNLKNNTYFVDVCQCGSLKHQTCTTPNNCQNIRYPKHAQCWNTTSSQMRQY